MKSIIALSLFALSLSASASASSSFESILKCHSNDSSARIQSLHLKKDPTGYQIEMESSFEDGIVVVENPETTQSTSVQKFILKKDHDLKVTLAVSDKKAVVLFESVYDASEETEIEFLDCQ